MQRRAYVPGVTALLAVLLAGCTGGSGDGSQSDNSNPGSTGTTSPTARPGRYATLPEPCGVVGTEELDRLLPGIGETPDEAQRAEAYEGKPTLTYDTDRKVGCGWKVESAEATSRLVIDFERVVSYDDVVGDDNQAGELFAAKQEAADLPEPAVTASGSVGTGDNTDVQGDSAAADPQPSASSSTGASDGAPDPSATSDPSGPGLPPVTEASGSPTRSVPPADLRPRLLDGFGDEAFIDDELSSSGSTVTQRTVTVAFRTSNVIVTVEYTEQPTTAGTVPDSEGMQDNAQELASLLADSLNG